MHISVIIPIFRVEAYIERCARSLMEQTLEEVEFIFVDDCSPDGSVDVLQRVIADYPEREGQVRIIRHERNRGLPAARNTGLTEATGEYIFHCDSDDFIERDAVEKMYEIAKKEDADIVYTDWYLDISPSQGPSLTPPVGGRTSVRYMRCPTYSTPKEALRGLLHGTMKYNVWNKLVRKSLYGLYEDEDENENDNEDDNDNENQDQDQHQDEDENVIVKKDTICPNSSFRYRYRFRPTGYRFRPTSIRFPEGHGMGEDMTMILLFARARKVAYLPVATYHYVRQNENAFTASCRGATGGLYDDLRFNAERVIHALTEKVADEDLACFKLNVKYPFLISNRGEDFQRWNQWFPEANKYISSHHVSHRARLLEHCAAHRFYAPLKLHYHLFHMFTNA